MSQITEPPSASELIRREILSLPTPPPHHKRDLEIIKDKISTQIKKPISLSTVYSVDRQLAKKRAKTEPIPPVPIVEVQNAEIKTTEPPAEAELKEIKPPEAEGAPTIEQVVEEVAKEAEGVEIDIALARFIQKFPVNMAREILKNPAIEATDEEINAGAKYIKRVWDKYAPIWFKDYPELIMLGVAEMMIFGNIAIRAWEHNREVEKPKPVEEKGSTQK